MRWWSQWESPLLFILVVKISATLGVFIAAQTPLRTLGHFYVRAKVALT